jgi:hypothetical protein
MDYAIMNVLDRAKALRAEPKGLYGLCQTLRLNQLDEELVQDIFKTWPKFTGDLTYPVPCPGGHTVVDGVVVDGEVVLGAKAAKAAYDAARDMYSGEYGALRIELLDHLIEFLERELG